MRVRVIRDVTAFHQFEKEWTGLISDSPFSAPYYSWHWYWISWKAFAGDESCLNRRTMHVVVLEDSAGRPLAIAPLMREMSRLRGLPVWQLAFISSPTPRQAILFRNGVSKNDAMAAIAGYLVDCRRQWDMITLIGLDEESSDLGLVEASVRARGLPVVRHDAYTTPYIQIGDDFQKFLRESLNRSRRQSIGRKVRRLNERNFRIVEFTRPEEMPEAVELVFSICRASWKAKAGLDITSSTAKMQFYREIANHFACHGQTRIWVAMLDEQPIALEYHVTDGKKLYFLDTDFDQGHGKLSPGTVLLYRVLEQLHSEPIDEFDFGGATLAYKLKWATGVRRHFSIEIFNQRLYSRFLYQVKSRLMPAFRKVLGNKTSVAQTEVQESEDE